MKKGDHFRLIDEVPADARTIGYEDGETVHVAGDSAVQFGARGKDDWSIPCVYSYEGIGVGFGLEQSQLDRMFTWTPLHPIGEAFGKNTVPRAFPYRFD